MNTQTIFQAGNSQVVSIPRVLLSELGLKTGHKVTVDKLDDSSLIIKKVEAKKTKTSSKQAYQKWLNTFMKENGEILDELASR